MGALKETFCNFFPLFFHILGKSCSIKLTSSKNSHSNTQQQTWTYVTDRAGWLAVANMPLLWLFAGRNDIFLWLTGWNFGTFNIFHRYVARIVTTEAIVHGIGYTGVILKCRFSLGK